MEYSMKYSLQLLHKALKSADVSCIGVYNVGPDNNTIKKFDFGLGQWDCSNSRSEHDVVLDILDYITEVLGDKHLADKCLKYMDSKTEKSEIISQTMTRRDHMAALVLPGLAGRRSPAYAATRAVEYVDALIAELDKPRDK